MTIIEGIECIQCSLFFWAPEGSASVTDMLCVKCLLNKRKWYICSDCRMRVSTVPCFICEKGLKNG